ncbi:uncharacterized protein LOC102459215 [Pelodiscus sinensis]|uniref:uncharacterized protein LOC102459215 n=1 Tax=Pelodiscus sinensis TaxID=13735 RepID=UPI003F6C5141
MEGPGRALLRLAAACCLLPGLLLPPPALGDGQKSLTAQPSTVPGSFPLSEAGGFSREVTALPATSTDENAATAQPRFNSTLRLDESPVPPSPNATAGATDGRLHTPAPAIAENTTPGLRDKNLSANSSAELLAPAANATNASQPAQEGTEPSSTTEPTGTTAVVPTLLPPKDSLATTGSSQLESSAFNTSEPRPGTPDPRPHTAPESTTEKSTAGPTTVPVAVTTGSTPAATTASTTVATPGASPTTGAATTARIEPSADPVHEKPSVLDVGDDDIQDLPSSAVASTMGADPLVIGVVSMFAVMVGILALVGLLRYRQRNSRVEFRRLQDLPMDDMMEDTPLSLYSY